jgi:hypothetical protein
VWGEIDPLHNGFFTIKGRFLERPCHLSGLVLSSASGTDNRHESGLALPRAPLPRCNDPGHLAMLLHGLAGCAGGPESGSAANIDSHALEDPYGDCHTDPLAISNAFSNVHPYPGNLYRYTDGVVHAY